SQSVISKFNKTQQHTRNYNTKTKYNYWPIWETLLNFIKSQNINITFHKVQAHSDNEFNNTADFLASHHSLLEFLEFKYTNYFNNSYILQWENFSVEQPTRKFIKNICNTFTIALWSSQFRAQLWKQFSKQVNWNITWAVINNNLPQSSSYTNYKLSKTKTF